MKRRAKLRRRPHKTPSQKTFIHLDRDGEYVRVQAVLKVDGLGDAFHSVASDLAAKLGVGYAGVATIPGLSARRRRSRVAPLAMPSKFCANCGQLDVVASTNCPGDTNGHTWKPLNMGDGTATPPPAV